MKIEVLLATMFQDKNDQSFLKEMNIQSDIVVANQCDVDEKTVFDFEGHKVSILSSSDRGVGKNRNKGLFYSDADIVIFADNDVKYYDGYKEIIENYYINNPKADIVIFNFKVKRGNTDFFDITHKNKRASAHDTTRFGTYAVTAKRDSLLKKRISFSLLFGGGAKYQCGEDSLFLRDCYKSGLKIFICSKTLGKVEHKESTWFNGVDEKYCFDKGVLFKSMFGKKAYVYLLYHVYKHKKMYAPVGKFFKVYSIMKKGADSI